MSPAIAFVERPEELGLVPADALALSVAPEVELARPGIPRAEDLVDPESLESIGDRNLDAALSLCEAADEAVAAAIGTPVPGPGRWHVWHLKLFLDALAWRSVVVRAAAREHGADRLVVFDRPAAPGASELIDMGESLWVPAATTVAAALDGVEVERVAAGPANGPRRRMPDLRGVADRYGRDARALVAARRGGGDGPALVVLDLSYGVAQISRQLAAEGWRGLLWGGADTVRDLGALRARAASDAAPGRRRPPGLRLGPRRGRCAGARRPARRRRRPVGRRRAAAAQDGHRRLRDPRCAPTRPRPRCSPRSVRRCC